MNSKPKVSICIPTLNRVDMLKKSIESSLGQTYANIEVIVSDNGSVDETSQLLSSMDDHRIVALRHNNTVSMQENWNTCLRKATGDFFVLLSDDDHLEPTAIETMMDVFADEEVQESLPQGEIGIVYCQTRIIDSEGVAIKLTTKAPKIELGADLIKGFFSCKRELFPCSLMLRTNDIRELGGFDSNKYTMALDVGVWMSVVLKRGYAVFIDKPLSNYMVHHSNVTSNIHIDEWLKGIDGLEAAYSQFGCFCTDGNTAEELKESVLKYKALVINELIARKVKADVRKLDAVKSYLIYSKHFIEAGLSYFMLKRIVKVLLSRNAAKEKYIN